MLQQKLTNDHMSLILFFAAESFSLPVLKQFSVHLLPDCSFKHEACGPEFGMRYIVCSTLHGAASCRSHEAQEFNRADCVRDHPCYIEQVDEC